MPHSRVGSIDDMHAQLRESIVAAIPTIDLDSLDANPLGCEDCPVTLQYFAEDDAVVFVDKFCNMQGMPRMRSIISLCACMRSCVRARGLHSPYPRATVRCVCFAGSAQAGGDASCQHGGTRRARALSSDG